MSGQPLRGFTDADSDGNAHANSHANSDSDGNAHSYAHANSDSNAYSHTNRGETVADAAAATNITAAAPLAGKH